MLLDEESQHRELPSKETALTACQSCFRCCHPGHLKYVYHVKKDTDGNEIEDGDLINSKEQSAYKFETSDSEYAF